MISPKSFGFASGRPSPPRVFRPPVVIRPADLVLDRVAILDGAVAFAEEAGIKPWLPARFDDFQVAVEAVLAMPFVEVLLAVDAAGAVAGGLGISVLPYIWNPQLLMAEELFWWAWPGAPAWTALRLIRSGRARMVERGAHLQSWAAMASSADGVAEVYARIGARPVQTTFMGRL
jgi:hypothetical protein